MAGNTLETSRGTKPEEAKASENGKSNEGKSDASAKSSGGGAVKAWLPLIVSVVAMPVLAYATTHFVLLPKLEHAMAGAKPGAAPDAATTAESAPEAKSGEKPASGKTKVNVALTKLLVNVAGTMGTRYLMTSLTLVGNTPEFKDKIEENKDQLMDLATGTLSAKTISDLEKPGARNVIRAELLTVFNNALGGPLVQEIYITELAIQ